MKRIFCLLLALILLVSAVGCSFDNGASTTEQTEASTRKPKKTEANTFTETEPVSSNEYETTSKSEITTELSSEPETNLEDMLPVPDVDWGGREFWVLSVKHYVEPNFEVVGLAKGNRVSAAVYQRNMWLSEQYGVDIQEYGDSNQYYLDLLQVTKDNGDDFFDLVFLYRDEMASAIQTDLMKDLTNVNYLDLTNDWYNENTIESMKISDRLFHMVSDFSLIDKARTNVMFLNRDLATANEIPDILASVRDGNWTIEKMLEYQRVVAHDTGDGVMGLEDYWGLVCGGSEASTFWVALGNKVVTVNDDDTFSIGLVTEHSQTSIEKAQQLFDANITFSGNKFGTYSDAFEVFVAQRTLFLSETLSTIEKISPVADFSFSAIPYPKFDTAQTRYYTTNDNTYCATFGIPTSAGDANFSGFMIEALSWKSHTTTFPEYYNVVCKVQNSYDAECAEMLDLIFDGLVFDFGLLNSQNITGLRGILERSIQKGVSITSEYGGKAESIENTIQHLFDSVKDLKG